MLKVRTIATVAALVIGGALAAIGPMTAASAAACASPWQASAVYTGGMTASHNGRNWLAKWWTQGEAPPGTSGVWADQGVCGGTTPPNPGTCNHPNWVAGQWYTTGSIVRYTNGLYYIAEHDNPGYDPTISTWYWDPYTCSGQPPTTTPPPTGTGFVVSEAMFNSWFPSRVAFYNYSGFINAVNTVSRTHPGFATTGSDTVRKQEAAAFFANINHESGGLRYITEINRGVYCDTSRPYGCPAGAANYYGRGPIQLSWNFNYYTAGQYLSLDLLNNPWLVEQQSSVAWQTAIWYWMTQNGPGPQSAHAAITGSGGFGGTIRAINGALECSTPGPGNPAQRQSRITKYQQFSQALGVPTASPIDC